MLARFSILFALRLNRSNTMWQAIFAFHRKIRCEDTYSHTFRLEMKFGSNYFSYRVRERLRFLLYHNIQ
jgi:hypothetical protein